ncbi:fructose-1,6-bisphosphatase-3 [Streptohalobacillus salinus]|uniref:Fructose-1,6-bisphosphatase class 3 n=1 Tax=Streptohalobacillus salinus TaxID=621096 RepID=A0A2V3WBY6_9BACI|nr:fructose-1,6-bisphosphatase [Streptohalobacillus salinus]PXW92075.1 fructose-1,6-bisphosphatase-3 [Streptohalobacillus salinus]
MEKKYLDLLKEKYDTEEKVATEIINLEAILNLPKGTEHFVSDLHGEYQAFSHVLRNGSGKVKEKITDLYGGKLVKDEIDTFSALVYYPEEKLKRIKQSFNSSEALNDWYEVIIERLVHLVHYSSSKYTRSKLRKALPPHFIYIVEELLYKVDLLDNKKSYYKKIVQEIISLNQVDKLIIGLCYTVQRLVVDHLHVVGDIYDRGPKPDKIMETLINHHSVDIQWGNHDVLWLGAFSGSKVCLANILRICARYNNLAIIEDVYGINLRPLQNLADKYYDDHVNFQPKLQAGETLSEAEFLEITKMHQAIAMIQFKLEIPIIKRRKDFNMGHRTMLDFVDYETETIQINGKDYPLIDPCFQTVNPKNPEQLTDEEQHVIDKLLFSIQHSEKLKRHMDFLMKKGSFYGRYNGNLLIHGCVPLDQDGNLEAMTIDNEAYQGRDLLDLFETTLRHCYKRKKVIDDFDTDLVWYMWTGEHSSLFGKKEMTTFERYFIEDTATHKERKNPYYYMREDEDVCRRILTAFDLDPDLGHIINGHTPVKEIEGENPIKANGKMIVIDGGFSKAYQKTTGIAGYTLVYNSYGIQLVAHQYFHSKQEVIENGTDVLSVKRLVDKELRRKQVRETNIGTQLIKDISFLKQLLATRYLQ